MATLTCRIVRPDKELFEGEATSVVLVTRTGEMGVLPGHSSAICALGDGVFRVSPAAGSGAPMRIIISGGYAEITPTTVIVLADHARDIEDIDVGRVQEVRAEAEASRDAMPEGDHGRAYYQSKIAWCDLLLKESPKA